MKVLIQGGEGCNIQHVVRVNRWFMFLVPVYMCMSLSLG